MSLKQIIHQKNLKNEGPFFELELPGDPMIYSIKYQIGKRVHSHQHFRNIKFSSMIKCFFRSYYKTSIPVVVLVRFYVAPPPHEKITKAQLKKETVPAVFAFELCDYLLSFLEMIHHILINSYKQIVKIEMEKFYSSNPRTVFKFMKWDDYVMLKNNNSDDSKSKGISPLGQVRCDVQSKQPGNESDAPDCAKGDAGKKDCKDEGSAACCSTLPNSGTCQSLRKKKSTAKLLSPLEKARRRQLREVSE